MALTIVKQLRKQLIRLGYIYFTFFRYIDSKKYRAYDIGFSSFLEYININKECDEPKKWYLLIMGFYEDFITEDKNLIVSFFKIPSLHSTLESYFDLGDYNKACELQNIVYNARKEILGENHPDTLNALSNLAVLYVSAKLYSVLKRTIKSHFRFNRPLFQTLLLSVHSKA